MITHNGFMQYILYILDDRFTQLKQNSNKVIKLNLDKRIKVTFEFVNSVLYREGQNVAH